MKLMVRHKAEVDQVGSEVGTPRKSSMSTKRWLFLVLAVVLLVVLAIGGAYSYEQLQKKPAIDIGTGQNVPDRVAIMPEDQLKMVAGVYIADPAKEPDWAYAKALALSALEKHQESLGVYKSIEKTGKAPYYVYEGYALAASRAGDRTLAIEMMSKAIAKLEADSSVSTLVKDSLKKRLNSKLSGFKDESK